MRVLLHRDTNSDALVLAFRIEGWIIDEAECDDEIALWAATGAFDLIVTESYPALKAFRQGGGLTPAMVVGDISFDSKIAAFRAGADDVVVAPCQVAEVVARAAAIVRRSRGVGAPVIKAGPMVVDLDRHQLTVSGSNVHLTGKEQKILEALITRDGRVQSKDDLMNALYNQAGDEPEQKIVDVFVCKLRKKLKDNGAGEPIETVWGRGYRFRGYPEQTAAAA